MSSENFIERSSGILLHPTSLPGKYGMGDMGPSAYQWVDTLVAAKQNCWQILPLGPTGYGDSPYQNFSAFAGNPYLISPDLLIEEGLLTEEEAKPPLFPEDKVDYGSVISFKVHLLKLAWKAFKNNKADHLKEPFETFCEREAYWLDDYALFMSIKDEHNGESWLNWEHDLRHRVPEAMNKARETLHNSIANHKFSQFLFFKQWGELKRYANDNGISIIGDIPIFISSDSSDLWAYPEGFLVDEDRRPTHVAGVPPDYFSATGQLWGNPLYDWKAHKVEVNTGHGGLCTYRSFPWV
jgi:4-alpha-glucanotransferase